MIKDGYRLRTGLTTGFCAAAAAKAAVIMLLSGELVHTVALNAATGALFNLNVSCAQNENGVLCCSVIKDAGDDPDATDGMKIVASVFKTTHGIVIDGGEGIGRATKPGLKVPVGAAAINPVPMQMIESAVKQACSDYNYQGGIHVTISAPGGAEVAKKTMNERLGIIGGISILGTTGIVEPMSEKALIDTIKAEIDVNIAAGRTDILVTPGNYGRDFAEKELGFDLDAAIKCSNFIGDTLDYARFAGVSHITLVGHAGKLVKLAGGIMNTHSKMADCRMEILAAHCAMAGAKANVIRQIMECVTIDAAMDIIINIGMKEQVWLGIGQRIGFYLNARTMGAVAVRYIVFTQEHGVLIDNE